MTGLSVSNAICLSTIANGELEEKFQRELA